MVMNIVSWNINSVRIRLGMIKDFLSQNAVDILALQEIKCVNELFPIADFAELGFHHHHIHGQKSYNGVAIFSKHPIEESGILSLGGQEDCRNCWVKINGIIYHNFYIPAGGDEPDTSINPKFAHKLQFIEETTTYFGQLPKNQPIIIMGDFNIAPLECDVWSHKALINVVSHTPIECTMLNQMQESYNFIDCARVFTPPPSKIYSWWSYRNNDWKTHNRGRRLDHIWASPILQNTMAGFAFYPQYRDYERPSDHIPIMLSLFQ